MKSIILKCTKVSAVVLSLFVGGSAVAQVASKKALPAKTVPSVASPESPVPATVSQAGEPAPVRSIVRKSFGLDYNSWYQTLLIKNSTTSYESQGLLYGLGFSYHHSVYFSKWGWGGEAGYIQGYGVTGKSSSTTDYYAKRVPLSIWRFGGRLFRRMNSNIDIGAATNILVGAQSWPADKGYTVDAKLDQVIGIFIDSRWRLVRQWEISQALGTYAKSKSIAWRLGATYSF